MIKIHEIKIILILIYLSKVHIMSHIVVLGAGIGGMPAAYELRGVLSNKEHTVTVVNANDYFQFVPSNPWLAVGWRTRKQITLPIEPYLKKKKINFIKGWVEKIDADANKLILKDGQEVAYDYLVITLSLIHI